jgi:hypothetical protein
MTLWATEYSSSGRYQAVPGTSVKSETLVALAATQKHITIARIRDIMRTIRLFLLIEGLSFCYILCPHYTFSYIKFNISCGNFLFLRAFLRRENDAKFGYFYQNVKSGKKN